MKLLSKQHSEALGSGNLWSSPSLLHLSLDLSLGALAWQWFQRTKTTLSPKTTIDLEPHYWFASGMWWWREPLNHFWGAAESPWIPAKVRTNQPLPCIEDERVVRGNSQNWNLMLGDRARHKALCLLSIFVAVVWEVLKQRREAGIPKRKRRKMALKKMAVDGLFSQGESVTF